jgi:hypothetical protein
LPCLRFLFWISLIREHPARGTDFAVFKTNPQKMLTGMEIRTTFELSKKNHQSDASKINPWGPRQTAAF